MNREVHVRFWEGVGVRFPCATQLSQGVRDAAGSAAGTAKLLPVLQYPASSYGPGAAYTGHRIFR